MWYKLQGASGEPIKYKDPISKEYKEWGMFSIKIELPEDWGEVISKYALVEAEIELVDATYDLKPIRTTFLAKVSTDNSKFN